MSDLRVYALASRGTSGYALLVILRRNGLNIIIAIPHRAVEDDVYKGMHIPKGATILLNARFCFAVFISYVLLSSSISRCRALSWDEKVYKEPLEFRPERFLPECGEPYPTYSSFGLGRR